MSLAKEKPRIDDPEWLAWKIKYNKQYATATEEIYRRGVYENSKAIVARLNADPNELAHYGPTQFSDMTQEEFAATYLTLKTESTQPPRDHTHVPVVRDAPENCCSWTNDKTRVMAPQNQGSCGGCWAFATAATLEGACVNKAYCGTKLSEQFFIDCLYKNANYASCCWGCSGGYIQPPLQFAWDQYQIPSKSSYSYTAYKSTCKQVSGTYIPRDVITSVYSISQSDEAIKTALYQNGPVSIGIDATYLQYYNGGLYGRSCTASDANHAVSLIGYNTTSLTDSSGPRWFIKNSWGTSWGYGGYFYMTLGGNVCHIWNYPVTVTHT